MTPLSQTLIFAPNPLGLLGGVGFLYSRNLTLTLFRGLSICLATSHNFPAPYMERSRRVSMTACTFSHPNSNNFCQFMTPKPCKTWDFNPIPPRAHPTACLSMGPPQDSGTMIPMQHRGTMIPMQDPGSMIRSLCRIQVP